MGKNGSLQMPGAKKNFILLLLQLTDFWEFHLKRNKAAV